MRKLVLIGAMMFSVCALAQHRKLQVEPNHSTVGFSISIAGFTEVTGKFSDYQIMVDWNDSLVLPSKINSVIQVSSINTGIPDRDTHLRSSDFFDEETYPSITFESDSIQKINHAHFKAYGKLNMHGITNSIVLPFEIVKIDGNTIGFKSRSKLNRIDYGVGAEFKHSSMPDFLSEHIEVQINFWTKKRKESD
jgi:polyisoprenoid-binding protein YceI